MTSLPAGDSISIVTSSPGLNYASIEAVVTVPTFRRPQQVLDAVRAVEMAPLAGDEIAAVEAILASQ